MKYEIQGIRDKVHQTFDLKIPNVQEKIKITLRYMPTQLSWYMDFFYNERGENGIKLVNSPNLLRSYKNILPFGLAVFSKDGIYPMELEAFSSGRVKLYILSSDYVQNLEESIYDR